MPTYDWNFQETVSQSNIMLHVDLFCENKTFTEA